MLSLCKVSGYMHKNNAIFLMRIWVDCSVNDPGNNEVTGLPLGQILVLMKHLSYTLHYHVAIIVLMSALEIIYLKSENGKKEKSGE